MTREEFTAKYQGNEKITGFGLGNVQMHTPCPFCAEADFLTYLIHEVETAMEKGAVCTHCKRGARAVFSRVPGGVRFELVQTEGPELPAWCPPMRHESAIMVAVTLNGAEVQLPLRVTFADVVKAAGLKGNPSIIVSRRDHPGFSIIESIRFDQARELKAGDRITAVHTGNA